MRNLNPIADRKRLNSQDSFYPYLLTKRLKKTFLLSAAFLAALSVGAQTRTISTKSSGRLALEKAIPNWLIDANGTLDISGIDAYGQPLMLSGNTPLERAQNFVSGRLREAGIVPEEWSVVSNVSTGKFTYINFSRSIQGREALFSHLRFQFAKDGTLVRLQMAAPEGPEAGAAPQLTADAVKNAALARPHAGEVIQQVVMSNDWVWMPEISEKGISRMQPAYPFTAEGLSEDGQTPANFEGYISAVSGKLLLRHNRTRNGLNLTIQGQKKDLRPTDPIDTVGFPDMAVTVGGTTLYTDANGFLAGTTLNAPVSLTLPLQGRWSKVNIGGSNGATPTINISVSSSGNTVIRTDNQVYQNAYYHVTRIHDFVKAQLPSFTGMDVQLPTNVDITTGTCNAFYNGNSINFYAAGGGCESMAKYSDIIYHEYGHGINERFYRQNGGGRMYNGALNEAYADVWAMLITKVPIIGEGSTGSNSVIRRYDNTTKKIPVDIRGEVHADGEMIAGSWWDVARYLGDADSMRPLFIESFYSLADGFAGNEPAIYRKVLVSALLADDDDNNLSNGTPHFQQIIKAFANHGIYLGAYTTVTHSEVANQPANTPVAISGTVAKAQPAVFGSATLFFRPRMMAVGRWDSTQVTLSGNAFTAQIPGQPAGTVMDYYIRVVNALAPEDVTYYPENFRPELISQEATLPYQYGVGLKPIYTQDFESDTAGWSVGNLPSDNATAGNWTWGKPIASYQSGGFPALIIQPGSNHTASGTKCLFTANFSSVESGTTTVLSPPFVLTGLATPVIEYYRWFGNDRGLNARTNYWRVQIQRASGGVPFYVDYTRQSDYNWRRRIFKVRDYMNNTVNEVLLRFTLSDLLNTSNPLEGAFDDVVLYDAADPAAVAGVEDLKAIRVYPNPAGSLLSVETENSTAETRIGLYDLQGRLLIEKEISGNGNGRADFNTSQIAAGSYFLRIQSGGVQQVRKVQVVH